MPLDNKASIKDIITSLQNLEGINAKAELASVIGSPMTDEDTMSKMVNQIQTSKNELAGKIGEGAEGTEPLQSLVDKVYVGMKMANGTFINPPDDIYPQGTIRGLDFEPKVVMVWYHDIPITNAYFYFGIMFNPKEQYGLFDIYYSVTTNGRLQHLQARNSQGQVQVSANQNMPGNNSFYEDGFSYFGTGSSNTGYSNKEFKWVAIG